MQEKLNRATAVLNRIAAQELRQPRHRHVWMLACKPHPHDGGHKLMCACGATKLVMNYARVIVSEDKQAHLAGEGRKSLCGKTPMGYDFGAQKRLCGECKRLSAQVRRD